MYYGYNFNKVDPLLRTFDVQHNAFSLSLAEVAFTKLPTPESKVGFRVDLDFGKTADLVASFEPADDGKEIYKHIEQAYGSLLTGKVQWDVGKFVTPIGAEVIESQDNWNYTRSDPLRVRDPVLPRGRARHDQREPQGHAGGPARQRLEQQQRDQREQDRSASAPPSSPPTR